MKRVLILVLMLLPIAAQAQWSWRLARKPQGAAGGHAAVPVGSLTLSGTSSDGSGNITFSLTYGSHETLVITTGADNDTGTNPTIAISGLVVSTAFSGATACLETQFSPTACRMGYVCDTGASGATATVTIHGTGFTSYYTKVRRYTGVALTSCLDSGSTATAMTGFAAGGWNSADITAASGTGVLLVGMGMWETSATSPWAEVAGNALYMYAERLSEVAGTYHNSGTSSSGGGAILVAFVLQ